MTARKKILFLVHRVPYPPNRGDRIRSFHLLEFLAARAEVWLGFLAEQPPEAETMRVLKGHCREVAGIPLNRPMRWLRAARSLAAGRTATEGLFESPELKRIVQRWSEEVSFDAVVVFCSSMAQYLDARGLDGVPVVVDMVDVDSQKWFDYADKTGGPKRWLFALEGKRLRRLESSLATWARAITLVSEHEADLYRRFCPADCVLGIGNGVDMDYFRPQAAAAGNSEGLVFVGALDYRANLDGAAWFCHEVWPEIYRRRPGARFTLVGSNPGAAARRLAEMPGVVLAGQVPDVRPYLADAALVVAPLRVARGIQNKVLEALAMGKAVLASPQSLEGLEVEPGIHVRRAAQPAEWIEAVVEMLDDPAVRERLGQAGRRLIEERYSWEARLRPFGPLVGLADPESLRAGREVPSAGSR